MKFRNQLLLLFFTLKLPLSTFAQFYPQQDFQSPMDTPLHLSAPFGSLRENHFHSGIDIRTYEKEGLPVYAIADGYLARIKYSPVGYGKALYIIHPNGYTSVYGHLQNAHGTIGKYIKKHQYEIQSFGFDHFLEAETIKVKKGDTIAWSGNTGGSTGPHLHFEIRKTRTEEVINPQLFGIPTIDYQWPAIKSIASFIFSEGGGLLFQQFRFNFINSITTDSGIMLIDTLFIPMQTVGFGVEAVDYLVDRKKEYSIYGLILSIDNQKYYQFQLDRFLFEDTRCINAHIDYYTYKQEEYRLQKLYVEDGNTATLYPYLRNKGKYVPTDTLVHNIMIEAYDFDKHSIKIYAKVQAKSLTIKPMADYNKVARYIPSKSSTFQNAFMKVSIPPKALYANTTIQYLELPKEKNMLSGTHQIHQISTPLHKSFSIAIKPTENIPSELQSKLLLAYTSNNNNWSSAGGSFENGWVTSRSLQFGKFAITIDTIPPVIIPLFKSNIQLTDTSVIRFKITDNFAGIVDYKMQINNKWVLAEYDAKNAILEYFFDEKTAKQKQEIYLTVSDSKQNQSIFKTTIGK